MNIVKAIPGVPVNLGHQNEHNTTQIEFDLGSFISAYGEGAAVLAVSRAGETTVFPAAVVREGNTAIWKVGREWTSTAGSGKCQLSWVVDDAVAKTVVFETTVRRSLLPSADTPDPAESYFEEILSAGAHAVEGARQAEAAAAKAESCATVLGEAETNEKNRVTGELLRVHGENVRSQAEEQRAASERERQQNEVSRSKAETLRAEAEIKRDEAVREALKKAATALGANIYVQSTEPPADAPENSLWVDLSEDVDTIPRAEGVGF